MNNLKIELTPEEFKALDTPDKKLDVIYSALVVQQKHCTVVCEENGVRFVKLEKRKLKDSGLAALFGALSGFFGGWMKGSV